MRLRVPGQPATPPVSALRPPVSERGPAERILVRDGTELMLQTLSSAQKDEPKFAPAELHTRGITLYIEMDDFADTRKRLEGYPIVMEERVTFYGMREIGVSEPNGHPVIFAAREG